MIRHFVLLLLLLFSLACNANARTIYIHFDESRKIFKDSAIKIQEQLQSEALQKSRVIDKVKLLSTAESSQQAFSPEDLVINVGAETLDAKANVIYSFIPEDTFLANTKQKDSEWTLIPIDQPMQGLVDAAIKLVKIDYKNEILIAISEKNQKAVEEINKIKTPDNVVLKVLQIKEGEIAGKVIESHLPNAAALIAVRDRSVWSGKSARWMLHQAYNYQVPIVGYSKSFVKAGAMVSIYSSADNIIRKTVSTAVNWIDTNELTRQKVIYPERTLEVNHNIASALNYEPSVIKSIEGAL